MSLVAVLVLGAAVCALAILGLCAAARRTRSPVAEAGIAAEPGAVAAERSPSGRYPTSRLRILIVDDEPRVGEMIARLMTAHEVTTVTSGEAALATLATDDQFDAILCDLIMPGMSGVELAEVVAERHRAVRPRMVFLTSYPSTPAAKQFLTRSEARWLTKPVRYAQLATCVSEVVAADRAAT